MMRKIQIGVVGSASSQCQSSKLQALAYQTGQEIAKRGAILIYGAEKDCGSLPSWAADGAKSQGGEVIAITYGKEKKIFRENADIIIATGLERGGGREFSFILSCDALVGIAGGSGTLAEIAKAYQANIPVVVFKESGGWSKRLAGKFLDERRRLRVTTAKTPEEAIEEIIHLSKRMSRTR